MKRRAFLKGFPAVLAGPALLGSLSQASPSANPPVMSHTSGMNVLFINIEDLGANAVGCYGNPTVKTPRLDQFAAEATRFTRCYCQAPICHPSQSSFLTGLRPDTTRVYEDADPTDQLLPEGTRSLPEILRQYNIGDVNIGGVFRQASPDEPAFTDSADSDIGKRTPALEAERAAHIFAQMARQKKQFFMSLGFSRPHPPLQCPAEYLDLYDLSDIPSPRAKPEADANIPAVAKRLGRNYDMVTDEAARQAIRTYYGCVSFIDAQIGMVLEAIEREGLRDDTIVIIFSDHGFQLGEHGLWGKCTLFEQSTRVPLLVRVPGLTANEVACDAHDLRASGDSAAGPPGRGKLCPATGRSSPAVEAGGFHHLLDSRPRRPFCSDQAVALC